MRPLTLPRLRIQVAHWHRRALVLTDTPDPDCPVCEGDGGTEYPYGDYDTGEYAGSDWDPCWCWNENRRWTLLPLPHRPRWMRRRTRHADPWTTEPPF
ncbi:MULTISPECIES: hypothetical protein [Streptomyces]|uniref:hypothetical protein n=1 Tax=Streptomyces TaxID=1883 RepID=UPI000A49A864|nr:MULTISPECIES: hypothetical protein [Streptomyces]